MRGFRLRRDDKAATLLPHSTMGRYAVMLSVVEVIEIEIDVAVIV